MTPSRRAFMLLELLIASAIAVILAGAVLSITAGLARDRQRMERRGPVSLHPAAAELIRWDLVHTSKLTQDGAMLTLISDGGLDGRRLRPGGMPVRVTYRIESGRLVREQAALDAPLGGGAWRELVAVGVEHLSVAGAAEGEEMDAPPAGVVRVGLSGGGMSEVSWRR